MTKQCVHPLLSFQRDDQKSIGFIKISEKIAHKVPETIYGNFFEHLGFAIHGGLWAQILANPTLHGDHNLSDELISKLLKDGEWLTKFFLEKGSPKGLPEYWQPGVAATGFGVAILDNATSEGIPLPWKTVKECDTSTVFKAAGRVGHAVRLHSEMLPVGICQGVFLPTNRTNDYEVHIWARKEGKQSNGDLSVQFRRRINGEDVLASTETTVTEGNWRKYSFTLSLEDIDVGDMEPLDFCMIWNGENDLLVDRIELFPSDHISGFDPEIIKTLQDWEIPLLRGPGGNFISGYHWRDGIGPVELRPTRPNQAWGGLEYNAIGTDELLELCKLIGAVPHMCVNIGTGTAEEAKDWVQYCNGSPETPMGKRRAENGRIEPYNVELWEVGNEIYANWQIGNCGSEENARRYIEFERAMRRADPSITLIATGNPFDFVEPGPHWSFATADRMWHKTLVETSGQTLDYVSLHALPENERKIEDVSHEHGYYGVLAHPVQWERHDIPELIQLLADNKSKAKIAITEWGALGTSPYRPRIENFAGGVIYGGLFLNFVARNAPDIPIANATGILHGGCIRKAAERVYVDAQYWAIVLHQKLVGYHVLPCEYNGPGYDITNGTETTPDVNNVPLLDVVAGVHEEKMELVVILLNRSLDSSMPVELQLPPFGEYSKAEALLMHSEDPMAISSFTNLTQFEPREYPVILDDHCIKLEMPSSSLVQLKIAIERKDG